MDKGEENVMTRDELANLIGQANTNSLGQTNRLVRQENLDVFEAGDLMLLEKNYKFLEVSVVKIAGRYALVSDPPRMWGLLPGKVHWVDSYYLKAIIEKGEVSA